MLPLHPGKAGCPKAPPWSPNLPVPLPLLQGAPNEPHLQHPSWHQGNGEMGRWERSQEKGNGAGERISSALPMATGPAPSYKPPSPLPTITILLPEATVPSPPSFPLLQPLFIGKRWERVFLGVLQPSCSPSLLSWHSPACITPNQAPSLSVQRDRKGRRRKAMKNHHVSSLPANTSWM